MAHLVRIAHPSGRGAPVETPEDRGYFPAKTIVRWKKVNDWPVIDDFEQCGLSYDSTLDRTTILRWHELDYEVEISDDEFKPFQQDVMPCHTGEKLFGWPYWLQDPQRPTCPICDERMQFVFQFDSLEENIPYSFGDSGTGQIHQCVKHKDVLAFGWAGC